MASSPHRIVERWFLTQTILPLWKTFLLGFPPQTLSILKSSNLVPLLLPSVPFLGTQKALNKGLFNES